MFVMIFIAFSKSSNLPKWPKFVSTLLFRGLGLNFSQVPMTETSKYLKNREKQHCKKRSSSGSKLAQRNVNFHLENPFFEAIYPQLINIKFGMVVAHTCGVAVGKGGVILT